MYTLTAEQKTTIEALAIFHYKHVRNDADFAEVASSPEIQTAFSLYAEISGCDWDGPTVASLFHKLMELYLHNTFKLKINLEDLRLLSPKASLSAQKILVIELEQKLKSMREIICDGVEYMYAATLLRRLCILIHRRERSIIIDNYMTICRQWRA